MSLLLIFCLNRVGESRGLVWKERLLFSWGSEGETVKVSAERPTGQVLNLGVQGGPDGGNGLRNGGGRAGLATAQEIIKVITI